MDDHTPLWGQYIELKYPDVIIWFKSKSAQEQKAILYRGKLKLSQNYRDISPGGSTYLSAIS